MKNRFLLFLFTSAMITALLLDLRQWRINEGEALTALDRGVARYRQGDYSAALVEFGAASAARGEKLRQRALYNLGTTHLRWAADVAAGNDLESGGHLSAAMRHLGDSLALSPGDGDAAHNLALATERLSAMKKNAVEKQKRGEEGQKSVADQEEVSRRADPSVAASRRAARPGAAAEMDTEGVRRRGESVTRHQALRMLDEARGRESLRSGVAAVRRSGDSAPPERDW